MRRQDLLPRLGLEPSIGSRVSVALESAIRSAEARSPGHVSVLDAGCGRKSRLRPFRGRIARLVGVDLHEPDPPLAWLDAFAALDVCDPSADLGGDEFDLVLSSFTLEHFSDPRAAFADFHRWLRPGGTIIVTTVNRRHPFVGAYLNLPQAPRDRLQALLKSSPDDAHPLVGRCNDPATIRDAMRDAGFTRVSLETVPNLARSWARHRWTFALGLTGDLLTQGLPSRRSTVLARARRSG